MKTFVLVLVLVSLIAIVTGVWCASQIKKVSGGYEITISLTDAEYKAMTYDCYDVYEWIDNLAKNKARQEMDIIIHEFSDKRPDKITKQEKENIVKDANIKTAKERQDEWEANLKNGQN